MSRKTLYIVRHGKSTWDYSNILDMDRPLKEKGIENSYEMADRLKILNVKPGMILSSPATRAIHTAIIFSRKLNYPVDKIKLVEKIYEAGLHTILKIINNFDDQYDSLMIFGHNPIFTDLANHFTKNYIENIPTTGIVTLKFESPSWKAIKKENVIFENFDFPKKNVE
ncbi:MAG: SixA phosphatase family protein [bacterium]